MKNLESRLSALAIAYAQNRAAIAENARAIRALHRENDTYIDLKKHRDRYLSGEVTDDPECCIVWRGWVHAVDECNAWDGIDYGEDCSYRSMAILLDQRKALNREGGTIKNRLRVIGQSLLKVAP